MGSREGREVRGVRASPLVRLARLLRHSDVRRSPVRPIARRLAWRVHWGVSSKPIVVSGWWGDLSISLPRSGSVAPVFYDKVPPEPALAAELVARLAPGGVFVDVGAHVGVYSLIAAQLVGPTGRVFAIEPQAACLTPLHTNASLNGLTNVVLIAAAASDRDGETRFAANPRSMGGMIAAHGEAAVRALRLDTFAREHDLDAIDLVKLDAAGNEYAVLEGASELLREHGIGALLCKLYHPSVVAERFGYDGARVIDVLREAGYVVSVLPGGAHEAVAPAVTDAIGDLFEASTYSRTLLAVPANR